MRVVDMSAEQRRLFIEPEANYPLRVTFLGKGGLLSRETFAFLERSGVDLELDDDQAKELLDELVRAEQLTEPQALALMPPALKGRLDVLARRTLSFGTLLASVALLLGKLFKPGKR